MGRADGCGLVTALERGPVRIALVGRDADRVLAFRGSLIRLAQREGHQVIAITGPAGEGEARRLEEAGVQWFAAPLDGGGMNPMRDLAYAGALERILRAQRADAVLAYNPKCLAHAPLAARRAGARRVVGMVTGLGHGFIGRGWRERLVRLAKARLYRRAFAACDEVLVQNDDDVRELRACGALRNLIGTHVRRIAGSGVDLERFAPTALPPGAHFLMIARPLREKGLPEFLQASRIVHEQVPSATFTWLGSKSDPNPSAIDRGTLEGWLATGVVRYLPECGDVRPAIAACSIFVLPSHREGTSKVMLEAMAMGRPIITTDAPGCSHLVQGGHVGVSVPVGDVRALASAMTVLAQDGRRRADAGVAARHEVERHFDAQMVDRATLEALVGYREGQERPRERVPD